MLFVTEPHTLLFEAFQFFPTVFIAFYSGKTVSSSDRRKNEALINLRPLGIYGRKLHCLPRQTNAYILGIHNGERFWP